jgi:hypothetical protein
MENLVLQALVSCLLILSDLSKGGIEMRASITLEEIEKGIEKLTLQDQLELIEKLVQMLKKSNLGAKKELDWSKLYGLGKGLWNNEDAQEYVNRLREERM